MSALLHPLRTRPRMAISLAVGIAAALIVPDVERVVTRFLIGWNVGVWLYLLLMWFSMWRADHEHMRRVAVAQADSAGIVLLVATCAALVSIVAIVLELADVKGSGASHALPSIIFALATVAASWVLLPTLFALNYASLYYGEGDDSGAGLEFPDKQKTHKFYPDYADFIYFSMTIAVASQTADVAISTRKLRRLVTIHAALSFLFNTSILALTINIAAGLF